MIWVLKSSTGLSIRYLHMSSYIKSNNAICIMIHGYWKWRSVKWWVTSKELELWNRLMNKDIDSIIFDLPWCGWSNWAFEDLTIDNALESLDTINNFVRSLWYTKIFIWWSSFWALVGLQYIKKNNLIKWLVCWSTINDYEKVRTLQLWKESIEKRRDSWIILYEWSNISFDFIRSARRNIWSNDIEKISTPVLFVHGDADENAPLSWVKKIAIWSELCTLKIFEWEWHGFTKQKNRIASIADTVEFFSDL